MNFPFIDPVSTMGLPPLTPAEKARYTEVADRLVQIVKESGLEIWLCEAEPNDYVPQVPEGFYGMRSGKRRAFIPIDLGYPPRETATAALLDHHRTIIMSLEPTYKPANPTVQAVNDKLDVQRPLDFLEVYIGAHRHSRESTIKIYLQQNGMFTVGVDDPDTPGRLARPNIPFVELQEALQPLMAPEGAARPSYKQLLSYVSTVARMTMDGELTDRLDPKSGFEQGAMDAIETLQSLISLARQSLRPPEDAKTTDT